MSTTGRKIRRRDLGSSTALCDTCSARYSRRSLVRCSDGFLRCSGPGTLNDARGKTAKQLDEDIAARASRTQGRNWDDPGTIDKGEI